MFFFIYLILGLLFLIFEKNVFTTFISIFFLSLSSFFIIYYVVLLFYLKINKNIVLKTYSLPQYVFSSKIKFPNIFKFFFLSYITINIITDKQTIIFKCNKNSFETSPFFAGKHNTKKFFLKFSDPLIFFKIKINLKIKSFYNFFIKDKYSRPNFYFSNKDKEINEKKIKDNSIILRDYISGDDPRKILWKAYALVDELKVKEDWFEKSSKNLLKVALSGIYNIQFYYLTEHILKKLFVYIINFLNSGFNIILFDTNLENNYIYLIEKKIFDLLEYQSLKNTKHNYNKEYDIIFFSVFDKINFNAKNKIFLQCEDFFTKKTLNSIKLNKKISSRSAKKYFLSDFYNNEIKYNTLNIKKN